MEKLTLGKDPSEIYERQVFLIIGTIIIKRSSSVVVRTIFCRGFRVRASATLYNLITTWPLDLAFMLTS